jgi:hypothetical protein
MMDNSNLFLISFTILFAVMGLVVYNIDFSRWEDKHSHE